jgi:hypothetical protein
MKRKEGSQVNAQYTLNIQRRGLCVLCPQLLTFCLSIMMKSKLIRSKQGWLTITKDNPPAVISN